MFFSIPPSHVSTATYLLRDPLDLATDLLDIVAMGFLADAHPTGEFQEFSLAFFHDSWVFQRFKEWMVEDGLTIWNDYEWPCWWDFMGFHGISLISHDFT